MIDLIISATVGAIAGYGICAVMTVGKVADLHADLFSARDANERNIEHKSRYFHEAADAQEAHARCSDSRNTLLSRIDRALACETPKAAHGVKKMAAILRGEVA